MRVLTVTNQKGGVGKTVLACHLALAGVEEHKRVLLIDLDTQANATLTLTLDLSLPKKNGGSANLFFREPLDPIPTASGVEVLHGHQHLDALDAEYSLEQALPIRDELRQLPYDLIVVDTPPAIGLRHVGPILWCDVCLTPMEPNAYSVSGLSHTLNTLSFARRLNPGVRSRAIINRYIKRSKQHAFYIAEIARHIELTKPFLPLRVAVPDALDAGVPVWRFSRAAPETKRQWRELCGGFACE
jgi:chromosome partitioning protein